MPSKSRSTIGLNPLDAVVPDLRAQPETTQSQVQPEPEPSEVAPPNEANRKERLTIHLSSGLIERLKNAVFWTPGLTLADLGEDALSRVVEELEAQRGAPFPARTGELKGGRPLKRV